MFAYGIAWLLKIGLAEIKRVQEAVLREVGHLNWGSFKPRLTEATIAHLKPIQARYQEVISDPTVLDKVRGAHCGT